MGKYGELEKGACFRWLAIYLRYLSREEALWKKFLVTSLC